jgi:hypothetical protein
MKRAILAAVMSLSALGANAQVSCQQIGNQTYCSNGLSAQTIGNFTYNRTESLVRISAIKATTRMA